MRNRRKNFIPEARPAEIFNTETGRMMIIDNHVALQRDYWLVDFDDSIGDTKIILKELAGLRVI